MQFRDYIDDNESIRELSRQLSSERHRLRFDGIDSISEEQAQILFSHLPRDWSLARFGNIFDTESFENNAVSGHLD